MKTGVIKWFNRQHGYGFIVRDDGEKDIFFHCSEVTDKREDILKENQKVTFYVASSQKGLKAVNVTAI